MPRFVVSIEMDNDAFVDSAEFEVARILLFVRDYISRNGLMDSPLRLHDYNGNDVGSAKVEDNY